MDSPELPSLEILRNALSGEILALTAPQREKGQGIISYELHGGQGSVQVQQFLNRKSAFDNNFYVTFKDESRGRGELLIANKWKLTEREQQLLEGKGMIAGKVMRIKKSDSGEVQGFEDLEANEEKSVVLLLQGVFGHYKSLLSEDRTLSSLEDKSYSLTQVFSRFPDGFFNKQASNK